MIRCYRREVRYLSTWKSLKNLSLPSRSLKVLCSVKCIIIDVLAKYLLCEFPLGLLELESS